MVEAMTNKYERFQSFPSAEKAIERVLFGNASLRELI